MKCWMGWLAEATGTGGCVSDEKWGECQLGHDNEAGDTDDSCVKSYGSGNTRLIL